MGSGGINVVARWGHGTSPTPDLRYGNLDPSIDNVSSGCNPDRPLFPIRRKATARAKESRDTGPHNHGPCCRGPCHLLVTSPVHHFLAPSPLVQNLTCHPARLANLRNPRWLIVLAVPSGTVVLRFGRIITPRVCISMIDRMLRRFSNIRSIRKSGGGWRESMA